MHSPKVGVIVQWLGHIRWRTPSLWVPLRWVCLRLFRTSLARCCRSGFSQGIFEVACSWTQGLNFKAIPLPFSQRLLGCSSRRLSASCPLINCIPRQDDYCQGCHKSSLWRAELAECAQKGALLSSRSQRMWSPVRAPCRCPHRSCLEESLGIWGCDSRRLQCSWPC